MSTKYTNKALPDNPTMFPPPATWMSWTAHTETRVAKKDKAGEPVKTFNAEGKHTGFEYDTVPPDGEGKVRHHYNRAEARKALLWIGRDSKYRKEEAGLFYTAWRVYEWVDNEWVLRGSGEKGEARKTNEFFKQKQTKEERVHPFDQALEAAAIESIMKVAS